MDRVTSSNPPKVFFDLPALEKAKQRCIKSSVLIAFGPNVPHNLFCEWLQHWLGSHDISATMHKRVCEGFYVVVCDKEGACDILAPALKDYSHMRPAIFPLSVDLFTRSEDMVAKLVSLPGLPFLFQYFLPTIASRLGLFVGHTGPEDNPQAPRIPEDTYLGQLLYKRSSRPVPVKILVLAPWDKQIPSHLSLQISHNEWYRQTLVQETIKYPYSPAFPPESKRGLYTLDQNRVKRVSNFLSSNICCLFVCNSCVKMNKYIDRQFL